MIPVNFFGVKRKMDTNIIRLGERLIVARDKAEEHIGWVLGQGLVNVCRDNWLGDYCLIYTCVPPQGSQTKIA